MVEDCWRQLKFYYKKIHILPGSPSNYNVYLAGGFFTNYISKTSPYIQEFKQYFQYFDENKDVDFGQLVVGFCRMHMRTKWKA